MITGQLIINGYDAYASWGMTMDSSALSALMTPAPIKSLIENDSRLENGKEVITSVASGTDDEGNETKESTVRIDSRDVVLTFNITASNEASFLRQYYEFCHYTLETGKLDISTSFLPNVVFHMIYVSCTQFSEYRLGIGKFTLKLTEPNPANRI